MTTLRRIAKQWLPKPFLTASRMPRKIVRLCGAKVKTAVRLKSLQRRGERVFVELGPGSHPLGSPWMGIDISGFAELTWDLRRPLPFSAGRVSGIYSCHVLEHFSLSDLSHLLRECRRVLASDGFFMCAVPDAGKYVRAFQEPELLGYLSQHSAGTDYRVTGCPMDLLNMTAYMHGQHRTMFDSEYLCGMLRNAGFAYASPRPFDEAFDLPDRDWESLYAFAGSIPFEQCAGMVEASRPKQRRDLAAGRNETLTSGQFPTGQDREIQP